MIARDNVWHLVDVKPMKKISWGQNLGQMDKIWDQNDVFGHFLKFGLLVFL